MAPPTAAVNEVPAEPSLLLLVVIVVFDGFIQLLSPSPRALLGGDIYISLQNTPKGGLISESFSFWLISKNKVLNHSLFSLDG